MAAAASRVFLLSPAVDGAAAKKKKKAFLNSSSGTISARKDRFYSYLTFSAKTSNSCNNNPETIYSRNLNGTKTGNDIYASELHALPAPSTNYYLVYQFFYV